MADRHHLYAVYSIGLACLGGLWLNTLNSFNTAAYAQSITPAPDGTGTIVELDGNIFRIEGGSRSSDNRNLFHSFDTFGLTAEETAQFLADSDIQNILGRVVGGDASIIDGSLQITDSQANLFLMNPAGIIFGAEAQLNVPSNFTATTATGIGFDNFWFNAEGENAYGSIEGDPNQFAFAVDQPGSIFNEGNLAVSPGNQLMLVGGAVLNTGTLRSPNGLVAVVAVPGQNVVRLSQEGTVLNLEIETLDSTSASSDIPSTGPNPLTYTPLSLSDLLTGGKAQGHANTLEIGADGSIFLTQSEITIDGEWQSAATNPSVFTEEDSNGNNAVDIDSPNGSIPIVRDVRTASFVAPASNRAAVVYGDIVQTDPSDANLADLSNVLLTNNGEDNENSTDDEESLEVPDEVVPETGLEDGVDLDDGGKITDQVEADSSVDSTGETPENNSTENTGTENTLEPSNAALPNSGTTTTPNESPQSPLNIDVDTSGTDLTTTDIPDSGGTGSPDSTVDSTVSSDPTVTPSVDSSDITLPTEPSVQLESETSNPASTDSTAVDPVNDGTTGNGTDLVNPNPIETPDGGGVDTGANVGGGADPVIDDGIPDASAPSISDPSSPDLSASDGAIANDITDVTDVTDESAITDNTITDDPVTNNSVIDNTITDDTGIEPQGTVEPASAETNETSPSSIVAGETIASDVSDDVSDSDINTGENGEQPNENPLSSETNPDIGEPTIGPEEATASEPTLEEPTLEEPSVITAESSPETKETSSEDSSSESSELVAAIETSLDQTDPANEVGGDSTAPDSSTSASASSGSTSTENSTASSSESSSEASTETATASSSESSSEASTPTSATEGEDIQGVRISAPVNTTRIALSNADEAIANLEQQRYEELTSYFGRDLAVEAITPDGVQQLLTQVHQNTGNRAAIIYVTAPQSLPDSLFKQQDKNKENKPDFAQPTNDLEHSSGSLKQAWKRDPVRMPETPLELLIFTLDGRPVRITVPEVSREQLFDTIVQFRNDLILSERRGTNNYLPTAQRLYHWLIAPLEAELGPETVDTLLFAMDSGLRGLPIAALHDGEQFMVEKYSLGMVPSLGVMNSQHSSLSNAEVLAMGADTFMQQAPLPAVPVEMNTITNMQGGRMFLNETFTEENLVYQQMRNPSRIIHLATHAAFNAGTADQSYIQLWGNEQLSLREIQNLGWNNPAVDLLVLSACQTAVGSAEAEMGFAGLAVASGVQSALASLWTINDEGTLALMTEFYSHLDQAHLKAEALRQSQLAMLSGAVQIDAGHLIRGEEHASIMLPDSLARYGDRDLSHPYYWSGFTMIGNPW